MAFHYGFYKLNADHSWTLLFDSFLDPITSINVDDNGNIYVILHNGDVYLSINGLLVLQYTSVGGFTDIIPAIYYNY